MKVNCILFLFFGVALGSCTQNDGKEVNILLVGNSSIYYNNMPKMLEAIAAENGVDLHVELIAFGGYTLQDHLNDGIFEKMLDSHRWDFVILNEQSTLGENYVVNGLPRVRESNSFYESVRRMKTKIRSKRAKTIVISLYPRKNAPIEDGQMLDYSYMKIAEELKIRLSPVSYTWKDILKTDSNWQLYKQDNLHPTPLGSYITANVLYSTITNRKSKSIDKEIFGPLIEEFDGFTHQDSIVSLIKLDKSKSRIISEIAFRNVKELQKAGGYFQIKKPSLSENNIGIP